MKSKVFLKKKECTIALPHKHTSDDQPRLLGNIFMKFCHTTFSGEDALFVMFSSIKSMLGHRTNSPYCTFNSMYSHSHVKYGCCRLERHNFDMGSCKSLYSIIGVIFCKTRFCEGTYMLNYSHLTLAST